MSQLLRLKSDLPIKREYSDIFAPTPLTPLLPKNSMAGGRRPSNYAPSTRYTPQPTQSLQQLLSASATQAFWPSSVWQPPDLASTPPPAPPPLSRPLPPPQRLPAASSPPFATVQLAHALDAAVQAAVIRALDIASGARDDDASSSSSAQADDSNLLARLRAATDANAALLARIDAQDARAKSLERRIAALEQRARDADTARAAADILARDDAHSAAVRMGQAEHAAREETAALERRIKQAEVGFAAQVAAVSARVDSERRRADERESQEKAMDGLRALRARVKKVEAAVEGQMKKADEAGLLQDGAVENVRDEVAGLKRLVESNLRAHAGAESVVKQQVSLITKHVCVAMRSYTSKKIEENNRELSDRFLQLVSDVRLDNSGKKGGDELINK